ncbi:MAG: hypothetical protein A4E74_01728 [Syntrophus sp. PtaB.Bin075]|nr:MAG: hypothetical protein A4E74_01728 [Syntrophus sp. PtaB.Bin075]
MEKAHILPQGRKRHQRDTPVRQSEAESRKLRRHDLRQDPERHIDRRRRMEIPVIGRLHPQLIAARLDADIPESGGVKGADQALRQRVGTIFRLFPPGMIVDGNQGLSQVKARGEIDPELLPPLPADVDLRPIHGLPAQTHVPFRGDGFLEIFFLRRIAGLLFILYGTVFHHCYQRIGDRPLDTAEKLGVFEPGLRIAEDFRLEAFALGRQRFFSITPISKTNCEIKRINLLAHHQILGREFAGSMRIHDAQGHCGAIFALSQELMLQIE